MTIKFELINKDNKMTENLGNMKRNEGENIDSFSFNLRLPFIVTIQDVVSGDCCYCQVCNFSHLQNLSGLYSP